MADSTHGTGDFVYELVPDWAKLPDGWKLTQVAAVAVDKDDNVYAFKNGLVTTSPFILTYGPSDESVAYNPVTLEWFASSDDRSNLTFDLYIGEMVQPTSGWHEINNTVPLTEKITDIQYYDGYLWFSELDNFSIKRINLENDEISVFATDTTYLKQVLDFTIDSSGNLYTVSRPSTLYSSSTYVCKWASNGTRSDCNTSNDVRYGTSIDYYGNSIFVLQTSSSSSYKKIIELDSSDLEHEA